MKKQYKGYIDHFIYHNESNGYSVLILICDGEEITCVGTFTNVDAGMTLEVEGDVVYHAVYGEQLKISSYKESAPEDKESLVRYLGSGAIKGIGESLASRIVKKFGKDTFRIIEEEPERLAEVKGISLNKARDIAEQTAGKREMREAIIFLQKYGISNAMSVRIFNKYGSNVFEMMRENPYRLADDISGIGFRTADEIASKMGFMADSDYRIRSGIMYELQQAAMDGNSYLPVKMLVTCSADLLGVDEAAVECQVDNLSIDRKIVRTPDERIYAEQFFAEEKACASMLYDLNLCAADTYLPESEKSYIDKIMELEKKIKVELDELQRKAVLESIRNGIVIITGGPGTGKTTAINTIIKFYINEGLDIMLAAPTGRAAKRMTETTGYEAKTIHRMLEVSGQINDDSSKKARFNKNRENPLEADAIIIDEMSMVDMHLFYALLQAIVPGTHLILVGDAAQLPSVGPGQVLRDLIDSHKFPTIILKKIFRQAQESDIVLNAHRINDGIMPVVDNHSRDFFFLERNDVNVIYKHMVQLVRDKLPRYVEASPKDIQVLTPMRRGPLGAETLNTILQQYINPPSPEKKEYQYGEHLFREGDKVMQTSNNYQAEWEIIGNYNIAVERGTGIFNGDMGIVTRISKEMQEMTVEFDEKRQIRYQLSQLDQLSLAYAITIHKSQGSEYPAVVLPLLGGPKMLMNRNLLYTAVTRARNCVTILGSKETVKTMIDNAEQLMRYTGLKERIIEIFGIMEEQKQRESMDAC